MINYSLSARRVKDLSQNPTDFNLFISTGSTDVRKDYEASIFNNAFIPRRCFHFLTVARKKILLSGFWDHCTTVCFSREERERERELTRVAFFSLEARYFLEEARVN